MASASGPKSCESPTVERMTDDRKDGEQNVPSWQLPEKRQPETDAYHIWTPRPLLRSIYWKPDPAPPPDVVSSTYEVFIDQRAWLTMHEHVWQTPAEKIPFGYLVGDLCEDPNANRRFINITAALPARFDFREEEREQISREATLALQLEVERRRGVLAGWYHRHLGGPVAMSEADVRTHHKHFAEPWQCAFVFVARRDGCEGGCFRSSPEEFAGDLQLPFYEMASNESLLARGVKRSYVDWSNYITVDEIRSEPPPRPEIEIPEESEEASVEADEELELAPFDADPEELEGSAAPGQPMTDAATSEPERPESGDEPDAKTDQDFEEAGVAFEVETDEAPEEVADETERTAEGPGEAGEDLDLDAAMDEVRPARIELDAGPEPEMETETAADVDSETSEAEEAPTPTPARGKVAAAASRVERLSGNRTLIAMIIGGILLLAVGVGGYVLLRSTDGSGEGGAGAEPVASEPVAGETPAAADTALLSRITAAQVDSAGQEMLQAISSFYGRAVARERDEATCEELAAAFIVVEDAWIRYNTEFKAEFEGPLPDRLAQRDERLYAGVQDAEREFEASGCPRP